MILMHNIEYDRNVRLVPGVISIGRASDNDVQIEDVTVSLHHAKIFTYFSASYIEDLGSTNGTYLNGKRVNKHTLRTGDVVQIGKQRLKILP